MDGTKSINTPTLAILMSSILVRPPVGKLPKMPFLDADFDFEHTELGDPTENANDFDVSAGSFMRSPREQKLQRKLLRTDQRCFLSGRSGCTLQASHVIPPMRTARKSPQTRARVKHLRIKMEAWLTALWFNSGHHFAMDGRMNFLFLNECIELNKFGIFAFFPGWERLHLISRELDILNDDWAKRTAVDPDVRRHIPMEPGSLLDASAIDWELLILYQEDYFADGYPMTILDPIKRAVRRAKTDPQPDITGSDWIRCMLREDPHALPIVERCLPITDGNLGSGRRNGPLQMRLDSLRASDEQLSMFAMLVALHARVAAYCAAADDPSAAVQLVLEYTTPLVEKIFYFPPGARRPGAGSDQGDDTSTVDGCYLVDSPDDPNPAPERDIVNDLTYSECKTLMERMEKGEGGAEPFMQLLYGPGGPRFKVPDTRLLRREWEEMARQNREGESVAA